jgi:hypothetical protein
MIYYGITYLMKPQHTVVVFGRQKSKTSYLKTKYQPTGDLLTMIAVVLGLNWCICSD